MRVKGKVKWFDSRLGYGFVEVVSNMNIGEDIFVHHRALKCCEGQYKYLVKGEYVEFEINKLNNSKYKYEASDMMVFWEISCCVKPELLTMLLNA